MGIYDQFWRYTLVYARMNSFWTWVIAIVAVVAITSAFSNNDSNSNTSIPDTYSGSSYSSDGGTTIDRQDAINEYWDDIKQYLTGTETVEACSSESGNCYDLDADISSGSIDQIYFTNGGYLYFSADIDSDGNASDIDENGNNWDFTLDMNSSIVDDAITEWADANGYIVQ